MSRARPRIAAIVPALDEESCIVACLESLLDAGTDEVVVVDGGSRDRTRERARELGVAVFNEGGGLFAQLAGGVARTSGDVVLFHYADALFPREGCRAIARVLASEPASGGAFRLGFASGRRRYRVIAAAAGLRNRLGLGPFGDQSIFVRRETFAALGGFSAEAFFEDLDLVQRLRARGEFVIVPERVVTSVRRWERRGFARTVLGHAALYLEYFARRGKKSARARRRTEALRTVR